MTEIKWNLLVWTPPIIYLGQRNWSALLSASALSLKLFSTRVAVAFCNWFPRLFYFITEKKSSRKESKRFYRVILISLNKNVSHCFDEFVTIICSPSCYVSTRAGVIRMACRTKTDPGTTMVAIWIIIVVTHNTDSSLRRFFVVTKAGAKCVEPLLVTCALQWGAGTKQWLPFVSTQWGWAVLTISNQRVQRICPHCNEDEVDLMAIFHT